MRIISRIALALVVTCALVCAPVVALATPSFPSSSKPIPGAVITRFVLPEVSWGSGHRGVDLAGTPGEIVLAAADGTVTYAGVLAGRGVVVVDHGVVRTTYEPVAATVEVGDMVSRGQPIGRLQAGHPTCPGTTCLHWGLRDGDAYLDPLLLLGPSIRLLPASASPVPQTATGAGFVRAATGMDLVMPATGPVTSPYGMRRHPITGVWKLHDGTDFGASCGSPIRAAAAGIVVSVTSSSSYGNRLVIDHGTSGSARLVTSYNHAQRYSAAVGDRVVAGQVIGLVGSTGLATGCHLHFQVWIDGRPIDPMTRLT
jgi:murein DD-endopeptidase MepM/ murein hydrolase activator NlpD